MTIALPDASVRIALEDGRINPVWYREFIKLASQQVVTPSFTVLTLPSAATVGSRAMVTDANATTFASVVAGGGANVVPVYSDGTDWRIG